MIPFDFEYYRPAALKEATNLYKELLESGKEPVIFAGGTEIITLGRLNEMKTGAVIDIKGIPECNTFGFKGDHLFTGASLRLTEIEEINLFPLLSKTVSEIADRTARNKITAGGNICGQTFYREAVLPFLLTDSEMMIAHSKGIRNVPIHDIFKGRLLLKPGEFLVGMKTHKKYLHVPFESIKRRRQWDTGYPLLTAAAVKAEGRIRIAISGLADFPFRAFQIEEALGSRGTGVEERVAEAIRTVNMQVLDDSEGSSEYRLFVLRNILLDIADKLGGEHFGGY
ncbi:FAD binding domain-containing protein [Cytobacillus sp. FSL H8-0458]|uniref:FAD binding domain-containing protein n=1 Tax=Cytobacillus sp. FSL H8-0458 TaxID=2975346 RepID=UPI0030F54AE2